MPVETYQLEVGVVLLVKAGDILVDLPVDYLLFSFKRCQVLVPKLGIVFGWKQNGQNHLCFIFAVSKRCSYLGGSLV